MTAAAWRVPSVLRLARRSLLAVCAPLSLAAAQSPVPELGALPALSLYRLTSRWTNYDARSIALADLRGQTVVLAMVYTSCTMTCPLITREMLSVQRELPPAVRARVRFVLASFDPARDSLAALRQHAERMGLDDRWLVVRAPSSDVRQLAVLLGVSYRQLPSGDFDHSNIISVLDARGVLQYQSPRVPSDRPRLVRSVIETTRAPTHE